MVADSTRSAKRSGTRKSRGRGLRTKTGCVTCRKRHLKCDETQPVCQNCSKKNKHCFYVSGALDPTPQLVRPGTGQSSIDHEVPQYPASDLIDAESGESPGELEENDDENPDSILVQDPIRQQDVSDFTSPNSVGTGSAANQPIGIATARWFEMIVEDANLTLDSDNTDQLLRQPEGIIAQLPSWTNRPGSPHSAELYNVATAHRVGTIDFSGDLQHEQSYPTEVFSWRSLESFRLGQYEQLLFANFTTHISQWIDLFDPYKHFASLVPRLALHNIGLMNAILAVSARHNSVVTSGDPDEKTRARDSAIRYYHESLHYVRIAMQDTSYHTSLELLATTLIISAFEMLDGSTQDWQRHLEGVFWIQRSQVIHGDSGGLRGAVWWAWLCQDIWAAFRSKRRVFTFWQPIKKFHDLDPTQLAARAIFLLGRVVNYCVKEISGAELTIAIATKLEQARSLSSMLDEWESFLTQEFMPLPCCDTRPGSVFKPVWIHPPIFASAMQLYHVSRLLICLHQPSLGGFHEHEKRQVTLNKHIDMICGIALKLTDYGPSIASSMSLFIAGTCTNGQARRNKIVALLEDCRVRTGWPVRSLSDELLSSWQEPVLES